jgi:erythronate-4-phosphate dehydrogenase
MKKGATLINTSRGRVVDEKALLRSRSRLGRLVLDVWRNEPEISLETLRAADIATPHIAGYSYDGKIRGTGMIYSAACGFFFRKPTWDPAVHIDEEPVRPLTFEADESRLYQAICGAYPVSADDERLRGLAGENAVTRGEYFDRQRKEYPKRLEFPHFSVPGANVPGEDLERLKKLGFRIDYSRDR